MSGAAGSKPARANTMHALDVAVIVVYMLGVLA